MTAATLAPGARVLIRDAEWVVRRKDRTSTGDLSILAVGVSEIVRGREARFLTSIEGKGITILDPAETELLPTPRRSSGIAAFTSKACCASHRPRGMTFGSGTRLLSTTCPTNSIRPSRPSARPTSAS